MTDTPPRTVVVVTGVGVHSDPWHGLEATSAAAAALLEPGFEVRHITTAEIEQIAGADLVLLNASGDLAEAPADSRPIVDALLAAHESGTPILALHSSSLAFRDDPRWAELLGGRWVPGVTMHPQIGIAVVQPAADPAASAFEVYDERYTALERRDDTRLVAIHTEDGLTHPLVWVRDGADGAGAVAYDALGHGVESYLADGHARLFRALVAELLAEPAGAVEPAAPLGRATAAAWDDVVVEAVGYELIAVTAAGSPAPAAPAAGAFDDAYLAPDRRLLVAGYLALDGDDAGLLRVIGHGRTSAELAAGADGLHVRALPSARIEGNVLRAPDAGLAIVAETGTWTTAPDDAFALSGDGWRAVIVHGPASAKVENRIRLRDHVRRLGRPEGSGT